MLWPFGFSSYFKITFCKWLTASHMFIACWVASSCKGRGKLSGIEQRWANHGQMPGGRSIDPVHNVFWKICLQNRFIPSLPQLHIYSRQTVIIFCCISIWCHVSLAVQFIVILKQTNCDYLWFLVLKSENHWTNTINVTRKKLAYFKTSIMVQLVLRNKYIIGVSHWRAAVQLLVCATDHVDYSKFLYNWCFRFWQ